MVGLVLQAVVRRLSVLAFVALVAGCSALGTGSEAAGPDAAPAPAPTSQGPSTTAFVSPDSEEEVVETIVDLEEEWAEQRAQILGSLAAAGAGIDEDNVLRGPGGFSVDLDRCPSSWEDSAGTDPSIRIVMTVARTGEHRAFSDIARGMEAYFDYVNENGGIEGRSIELVVRDDRYDPALTTELVDDIVETEDPLAVVTVGSPPSLAVYDDLDEACIPQPFVVSPHPAFGDPEGHPFALGFQQSYASEALLWGTWIKLNLAEQVPVRVGALVIDNEFGQIYADVFQSWASANRDIVSEVVVVRHDPQAETLTEEMAELAEAEPEVFLAMTAGDGCAEAVAEADRAGLTSSAIALFTSSVCKEPATGMAPAGDAGHGFWVVGAGVKSLSDPAYGQETFVSFARTELTDAGLDPDRVLVGVGFAQYGWAHVEALRLAAALPGGLTRSNLVLAMRSMELDHPMVVDGVRFAVDGNRDSFLIEGGRYSRYDSESQAWFAQEPAVDVDGRTPNCQWVRLVCQR